jgi:hypothetical protein
MEEERPTGLEPQRTPGGRAREFATILVGDWRPAEGQVWQWIRIAVLVGSVLLVVLLILYIIGLLFGITLLNLLKVLAVPFTVGAAVPLLNWLQKKRELDVENQRAQDEALQAYLDEMSQLLTDKDRPLHRARQKGDRLTTVARARTLTVLTRLDSERKGSVVQFLFETGLIYGKHSVLDLSKADLRGVNLEGAYLTYANLPAVDLRGADLSETSLSMANLSGGAKLGGAIMVGTWLTGTDLTGADLSDANLSDANLSDAKGLSLEQLKKLKSFDRATMPNGQKYEEWLEELKETYEA